MKLPYHGFLKEWLLAWLPWNTFYQHNVGATFATGDVVRQDYSCAARWYRRAARHGDADSQYDLGFMYLLGEGVGHNAGKGVFWLERAAEQRHPSATRLLADVLRDGAYGVQVDRERSAEWRCLADKPRTDGRP